MKNKNCYFGKKKILEWLGDPIAGIHNIVFVPFFDHHGIPIPLSIPLLFCYHFAFDLYLECDTISVFS